MSSGEVPGREAGLHAEAAGTDAPALLQQKHIQ